jgi:hypothetical protein
MSVSQATVVFFGLTAALIASHAAQPNLQPLPKGKWTSNDLETMAVDVVGNYAYVGFFRGGLAVIDVSNLRDERSDHALRLCRLRRAIG